MMELIDQLNTSNKGNAKMVRQLSLIFILVMSLVGHGIQSADKNAPTYDYHICSGAKFSPLSIYELNLAGLLFALSSNVNKNGFFNFSISRETTPVYGLYLCRADVSVDTCSDCVSYAVVDVVKRCPGSKKVCIWYDECSLRYSSVNTFGSDEEDPQITMYSSMNISYPNQLAKFVGTTMAGEMAYQAASETSGKNFAAKEVKLSSTETLYSLVQCTPLLSVADCVQCIQTGASALPPTARGARSLLPSCAVRYETYSFYNFIPVPAALPIPSRQSPSKVRPAAAGKKRSSAKVTVRIAVPVALLLLAAAAGMSFLLTTNRTGKKPHVVTDFEISSNSFTTAESLQFDLNLLQAATNNFSVANKLGEGGFGAVYRGKLPNGKEIAVKRLSRGSSQGSSEFKNEVELVAKLQHRNLVRLLGFCLAGDEKLLVYEFVPNKSLDHFLFDPEKQAELDWTRRYKIIRGIARGLLYLHEDSRLRIIHRDIKPANILLDTDMTPKISDFGLAKILGIDQSRGNTQRVAGTYGYIAPEYAFNGEFSESSDVYSYGVLLLEIISGQKINNFRQSEFPEHLMSYAWKKWKEDEALEIMEASLREGTDSKQGEVIRCIHLALLCVQEDVASRPSMSTVVMMLRYHSITLPQPQNPAFCSRAKTDVFEDTKPLPSFVNFVSVTEVGPR